MSKYPYITSTRVWDNEFSFLVTSARSEDWYDGQPSKAAEKMQHLREFFQPRDRVIDCGANEGYYAIAMARAGASRVIAIEPDWDNYAALVANIRLNKLGDKILPMPVALATSEGELLIAAERVASEGERILCLPLDDFKWFRPTFIKIDVEGFEVQVLQGAHYLLERYHPRLEIEVHLEREQGGVDLHSYCVTPFELMDILDRHSYGVWRAGEREKGLVKYGGHLRTGHYHCR